LRHHHQALAVGDDQREQEVVPVLKERDDHEGRGHRRRQRAVDLQEDAPLRRPVHPRGLAELHRHGQEELPVQEAAEG
jgi:hypothetical protein